MTPRSPKQLAYIKSVRLESRLAEVRSLKHQVETRPWPELMRHLETRTNNLEQELEACYKVLTDDT